MHYLGVDLGTSFIKGAVLDLDRLTLHHIERLPFPQPMRGLNPRFREFNPAEVVDTTRALLERLLRHAPDTAGVVMCSQMHSVVLTRDDGRAASNLISWQDQRALLPLPDGRGSYFDEFHATFEGMADNYARCAARLSPAHDWRCLVFSGGVALKTALLRRMICARLGQGHRLVASDEDTLLGLLVLSVAFSGRLGSVEETMTFVGREYRPTGGDVTAPQSVFRK